MLRVHDEELAARVLELTTAKAPKHGEVGNGRSRESDAPSTRRRDAAAVLAVLKRDDPELAAKVATGVLTSNAAAVHNGFPTAGLVASSPVAPVPLPLWVLTDARVVARWFARVQRSPRPGGCWTWPETDAAGYPRMRARSVQGDAYVNVRRIAAARVLTPAQLADDTLVVVATCGVRSCTKPAHLALRRRVEVAGNRKPRRAA